MGLSIIETKKKLLIQAFSSDFAVELKLSPFIKDAIKQLLLWKAEVDKGMMDLDVTALTFPFFDNKAFRDECEKITGMENDLDNEPKVKRDRTQLFPNIDPNDRDVNKRIKTKDNDPNSTI